ncbi:O-antigen ligase family protein [Rathayibacter sp. SD072]|uniref:O-antigen ligase family protein n=1 Tax=Rathayibacter sp. SD072 TaxID=2781731 RepID=UPI001A962B89|nr:O-antigen ligase family protein [Rathayibacter sp. SD072]MBO0982885.1 O-antigen ligase family protein [Rathayibacter sp. SD072]
MRFDAVQRLLFLAIVFMPFQQALTIRVGFPLKITEIAAVLAVGLSVVTVPKARHSPIGREIVSCIGVLVVLATGWALVFKRPEVATAYGYDLGFTNDMLLYCGYALLALTVWWFIGGRLAPSDMERALGLAVRLAFVYCLVQLALHFAGAPFPSFLNSTTQNGATFGVSLPRNGPFLEGNYLGFFAGVALFACLRRRDKLGSVLAVACLIYSQSTSALIATVAAAILTATFRPQRGVGVQIFSVAALGTLLVLAVPDLQRFILAQLSKLGFVSDAVDVGTRSLLARSQSTNTGFAMALDNPLFGVGPGRFGLWKDDYSEVVQGLTSLRASRGLANNAYAQLGAETGVIALSAFVLLLLILILRGYRRSGVALGLGIFLAVALTSAPSWTALTVWIALAYAASLASEAVPGAADFARPRRQPFNRTPRIARS